MIWTSRGNVRIDSLTLSTHWDVNDQYVKFGERYTDSTGEIVKESAHVYHFGRLTASGETGTFGG